MKRKIIALAIFTALSTSAMASENTWKDDTKDAWIDGKAEATLLFNTKLNSFEIDTDVSKGKVTLSGEVESEADKALAESVVREIDGVTDVDNSLIVLNTDNDDMDKQPHTAMKKKMDNLSGDPLSADDAHSVINEHKQSGDAHSAMNEHMQSGDAHSAMNDDQQKMGEMDNMEDSDDGSVLTDAKISTVVKSRLLLESDVSGTSINVDVKNRIVTLKGTVKSESERQLALSIAEDTDDVDSVNDELTIEPETN